MLFIHTYCEWTLVVKIAKISDVYCCSGGGGGFHTTMQLTMMTIHMNDKYNREITYSAIPKHSFNSIDEDWRLQFIKHVPCMYMIVCVRMFLYLFDWVIETETELVSEWERVNILGSQLIHTGSAMSIYIYRSLASSFFFAVPIHNTIRLNTFSWNFIVDRFKSCLFFSLLNTAALFAQEEILK